MGVSADDLSGTQGSVGGEIHATVEKGPANLSLSTKYTYWAHQFRPASTADSRADEGRPLTESTILCAPTDVQLSSRRDRRRAEPRRCVASERSR